MRPVSETVTKWERQKNGYWIRQNADGKFLDELGKVIPDTLTPDEIRWKGHIPYTGVRR